MKDKDDSIIDLSKLDGDDSFGSLDDDDDSLMEIGGEADEEFKIRHLDDRDDRAEDCVPDVSQGPASKVRVKFDKFITLVATHTYEDILKKNADEDVIISTNLLTDLANAHDEVRSDKKLPLLFAFGLIVGILVTWLILRS